MLRRPPQLIRSASRRIVCLSVLLSACLGVSGLSSLAAVSLAATCQGQVFTQPFTAFNDYNYYTLVPGGGFEGGSAAGWQLSGGARVVQSALPNGSSGSVLDLPGGAKAVSPQVCVTMEYPAGRVWVRDVAGSGGVYVYVSYTDTNTEKRPKNVGQLHGQQGAWTPSSPFDLQPETGPGEETGEVRLTFVVAGGRNNYQLYEPYIDPRMR